MGERSLGMRSTGTADLTTADYLITAIDTKKPFVSGNILPQGRHRKKALVLPQRFHGSGQAFCEASGIECSFVRVPRRSGSADFVAFASSVPNSLALLSNSINLLSAPVTFPVPV